MITLRNKQIMGIKRIFVFIAFVMTFAINAIAEDLDSLYATDMLKPGTAAPDFTLNDLDGKSHSLSSLKGSYVVLDFWASWCPDCRKDIPEMKRLYKLYGKDVKFVSVSFDDKKESWKNCVETNGMDWLHLSELKKWKETSLSPLYKIKWLPSTYILDRNGNIILSTVMIEKVAEKLKEIAGN